MSMILIGRKLRILMKKMEMYSPSFLEINRIRLFLEFIDNYQQDYRANNCRDDLSQQ